MASSSRRGAGERVLESKHVIGLFLLMLVFSGVFFSLGYVMGRNQYSGEAQAAGSTTHIGGTVMAKPQPASKVKADTESQDWDKDPATNTTDAPDWKFYSSDKPAEMPKLEPPPAKPAVAMPANAGKTLNAKSKTAPVTTPPASVVPMPNARNSKTATAAPLIPSGALVLQVAALTKQNDALEIASTLQKKHYSAYVQMPQKDKYYRVQVGPFKDQKSADAAKKGLESVGFKAFFVSH